MEHPQVAEGDHLQVYTDYLVKGNQQWMVLHFEGYSEHRSVLVNNVINFRIP
jgi:hypothetical protein